LSQQFDRFLKRFELGLLARACEAPLLGQRAFQREFVLLLALTEATLRGIESSPVFFEPGPFLLQRSGIIGKSLTFGRQALALRIDESDLLLALFASPFQVGCLIPQSMTVSVELTALLSELRAFEIKLFTRRLEPFHRLFQELSVFFQCCLPSVEVAEFRSGPLQLIRQSVTLGTQSTGFGTGSFLLAPFGVDLDPLGLEALLLLLQIALSFVQRGDVALGVGGLFEKAALFRGQALRFNFLLLFQLSKPGSFGIELSGVFRQ